MIPAFPIFKKLELSDRADIDLHTGQFPPYSDFEFGSIWSWDVKEEMEISSLHGNLVVKFTNYTTGEPFLSFLGTTEVNDTAEKLLAYSAERFAQDALNLIPEVTAVGLDPTEFSVEESRDHFDYVCDVDRHVEYSGNNLKSHRHLLRAFKQESAPGHEEVVLDMTDRKTCQEVADLYRLWDENKGFITMSEAFAYERFLSGASFLSYSAVGIRIDGKLVAAHIVSLPAGTCANALFSKADIAYKGVYAALDHVVAKDLLSKGYTRMNIQQDLGIENLRKTKLALHPSYRLHKYSVRRKVTLPTP